mgnify:CR=1 FL=1
MLVSWDLAAVGNFSSFADVSYSKRRKGPPLRTSNQLFRHLHIKNIKNTLQDPNSASGQSKNFENQGINLDIFFLRWNYKNHWPKFCCQISHCFRFLLPLILQIFPDFEWHDQRLGLDLFVFTKRELITLKKLRFSKERDRWIRC